MARSGVVYEKPGMVCLDTKAMPWQPFPGLAGASYKPLAADGAGDPMAFLIGMPPGATLLEALPHLPYRHYHRTVREYFFFLQGELPHWDYTGPDDAEGELVLFRAGYYLDRKPGPSGIHGIEREPLAAEGAIVLHWRDGVGNLATEPNFHEESIEVPYPAGKTGAATAPLQAGEDGVVFRNDPATVLDTREMAWQPFPGMPGCYRKVLSVDDAGEPSVLLVHLTARERKAPHRHYHRTVTECTYFVSGEYPHWEYESPDEGPGEGTLITFRDGYFMERGPGEGTLHGTELEPQPVGSTLLAWRSGPGNFLGDANADEETIEVPFA